MHIKLLYYSNKIYLLCDHLKCVFNLIDRSLQIENYIVLCRNCIFILLNLKLVLTNLYDIIEVSNARFPYDQEWLNPC